MKKLNTNQRILQIKEKINITEHQKVLTKFYTVIRPFFKQNLGVELHNRDGIEFRLGHSWGSIRSPEIDNIAYALRVERYKCKQTSECIIDDLQARYLKHKANIWYNVTRCYVRSSVYFDLEDVRCYNTCDFKIQDILHKIKLKKLKLICNIPTYFINMDTGRCCWLQKTIGSDRYLLKFGYCINDYHAETADRDKAIKVANKSVKLRAKAALKAEKEAQERAKLKAEEIAKREAQEAKEMAKLRWVMLEDSFKAGNCDSGTRNFLATIDIDYDSVGALRSDYLLELAKSKEVANDTLVRVKLAIRASKRFINLKEVA